MATKEFVEFVTQTEYGDIPEDAIRIAKRCILDTVGVALAGSKQPESEFLTEFVKEKKALPEAWVIGGGIKSSAEYAALANGTIAHALDYDDISVEFLGHPSTVLVPAILALSESQRKSGRDILCSFVIGFEVGSAIGNAMGVQLFESAWHATPIVGIMAATAAGAKLLRINAQEVKMAFGIAASLAGGLKENFGTMTKPLHAGNAARNSILAVLLAEKGFTAHKGIFESEGGLHKAFLGEEHPIELERNLGINWSILTPGVKVKAYPCCGAMAGCINAMLELKSKYNLIAEDVTEIDCRISPTALKALKIEFPKTEQESRFSLRYGAAIALIDGKFSLKQFSKKKLNSPITKALMRKVRYSFPPDLGRGLDLPQEVRVKLRDGREYSYKVENVKGSPGNPLSDGELNSKFIDCASRALNGKDLLKSLELLQHFEEIQNIEEIMELIGIRDQNK